MGVTQNQKFDDWIYIYFENIIMRKHLLDIIKQVCNVSLNQDGSNRTLFLTLEVKQGKTLLGRKNMPYMDNFNRGCLQSKLIRSIESPSEFSFDHSEWAFH